MTYKLLLIQSLLSFHAQQIFGFSTYRQGLCHGPKLAQSVIMRRMSEVDDLDELFEEEPTTPWTEYETILPEGAEASPCVIKVCLTNYWCKKILFDAKH